MRGEGHSLTRTTDTKKKATQMYNRPQPAADYSRTLLHVDRIASLVTLLCFMWTGPVPTIEP